MLGLAGPSWQWLALNGLVWPCLAIVPTWLAVASFGWRLPVLSGLSWSSRLLRTSFAEQGLTCFLWKWHWVSGLPVAAYLPRLAETCLDLLTYAPNSLVFKISRRRPLAQACPYLPRLA